MTLLELFVLFSAAQGYLLRLFGLTELGSHHGPFPSDTKAVKRIHRDAEGEIEYVYEAPVTLIDRLRRITPLSPYEIEDDVWYINGIKAEVWECPKCLSPWLAAVLVTPLMLLMGRWKQIPLMWLAVTGGGFFAYTLTEFLWDRINTAGIVYTAEEGPDTVS